MNDLEAKTAEHTEGTIALCVSYGGQADILQAVKQLIFEEKEVVTREDLESRLWTKGLPSPDLIIRTSGEQRLSNFLTWQSAYSELAFTDTYWPDFKKEELENMFAAFVTRERRHGF
jgi:undecaprenyl diphosphate synthase